MTTRETKKTEREKKKLTDTYKKTATINAGSARIRRTQSTSTPNNRLCLCSNLLCLCGIHNNKLVNNKELEEIISRSIFGLVFLTLDYKKKTLATPEKRASESAERERERRRFKIRPYYTMERSINPHAYCRLRFDEAAEEAIENLANVLQWHRNSPFEGLFVAQKDARAGAFDVVVVFLTIV